MKQPNQPNQPNHPPIHLKDLFAPVSEGIVYESSRYCLTPGAAALHRGLNILVLALVFYLVFWARPGVSDLFSLPVYLVLLIGGILLIAAAQYLVLTRARYTIEPLEAEEEADEADEVEEADEADEVDEQVEAHTPDEPTAAPSQNGARASDPELQALLNRYETLAAQANPLDRPHSLSTTLSRAIAETPPLETLTCQPSKRSYMPGVYEFSTDHPDYVLEFVEGVKRPANLIFLLLSMVVILFINSSWWAFFGAVFGIALIAFILQALLVRLACQKRYVEVKAFGQTPHTRHLIERGRAPKR